MYILCILAVVCIQYILYQKKLIFVTFSYVYTRFLLTGFISLSFHVLVISFNLSFHFCCSLLGRWWRHYKCVRRYGSIVELLILIKVSWNQFVSQLVVYYLKKKVIVAVHFCLFFHYRLDIDMKGKQKVDNIFSSVMQLSIKVSLHVVCVSLAVPRVNNDQRQDIYRYL